MRIKELEIENDYDRINYLNDRLNNNNLTLAGHKKISDDIYKIKQDIPKTEQKLYELKKDIEKIRRKKIIFVQAKTPEIKDIIDSRVTAHEFAIAAKEMEIKNIYDNINYLNDRLKNDNLKLDEHKKINDNIYKIKQGLPKKEQELYELKKSKGKKIRIDQAKSFKDQNK